jgi:hypothetical protein
VPPRIAFCEIVLAMLSHEEYAPHVARLKWELLHHDPSQESWVLAPLLRHVTPLLRLYEAKLLEVLAAAIISEDNRDRLLGYPEWGC